MPFPPDAWTRRLLRLAFFVGCIYLVYALGIYFYQRKLLFPAPREAGSITNAPVPRDAERFILQTAVGATQAWVFKPFSPGTVPTPMLVFAHGNGEHIGEWPLLLMPARRLGLAVALVEYPGYGSSEGEPSQDSITEAMIAAYDALVARAWVDASKIVVYGRSLGGGAALALSRRRLVSALLLQSTFTSVRQFAHRFLVPAFLVRDPFDNLHAIREFKGPVIVFHGKSDPFIPFEHGVQLSSATPKGRLVPLECLHNDCPGNWAAFWSEVAKFLVENYILL